MIFIKSTEESSTKARVTLQHFRPSDLNDEELSGGIMVESIPPEPLPKPHTLTTLYINPQDNTMWYEQVPDESYVSEMNQLKEANAMMQAVLDDLILNGGVI